MKASSFFRRIYMSMQGDKGLQQNQIDLKRSIVKLIQHLGYRPEIFHDNTGIACLASGKQWSPIEAEKIARRCIGAVIIGQDRWECKTSEGTTKISTEYCHYEGALVHTLKLPMLVLAQSDVEHRVLFDRSFEGQVGKFPQNADSTWLHSTKFNTLFSDWLNKLSHRRDVFLGYCSTSTEVAIKLKTYLLSELGVTVLDWKEDFGSSKFILDKIQEATNRCSAAIFCLQRMIILQIT